MAPKAPQGFQKARPPGVPAAMDSFSGASGILLILFLESLQGKMPCSLCLLLLRIHREALASY